METAGRWTTHALRVMDSIFCGRRGDTKASWTNRILSAEWDASHGFPVEVVTSKLRTILETHHQRTSALGRIISLVWLGLLAQCPEEIEVHTCIHNTPLPFANDLLDSEMAGMSRVPAVQMP